MQLNARTYGQGEPIIILHGLFGFSDNWQTIAKALADQYTVIALDQRNHGKSAHTPTHTYTDLASDLHHYLTDNWIFKAIVIGHSMGGKAAMQFALDNPDMVKALVVIDMAPGLSKTRQDDTIQALQAIKLNGTTDRKAIEEQLVEALKDPGVVQFLLKNLTRDDQGHLQWKMNLSVLAAAHDDILAPVQGGVFDGPTLFVRGDRSGYITEQDTPLIKKHFPKAEITTIPNAGHWVHAEQPKALLEVLNGFLMKLEV